MTAVQGGALNVISAVQNHLVKVRPLPDAQTVYICLGGHRCVRLNPTTLGPNVSDICRLCHNIDNA